jgi:hypothetical protein
MKLKVAHVDVWIAKLKDKPGMLAEKLVGLAGSGADLEFVFARRSPERPGTGVAFIAPIRGPRQIRAAKKAGFKKGKRLWALKVTGANKAGKGAVITEAIAEAGISIQGFSAHVMGKQFVLHLAFATRAAAAKAAGILRKL